MRLHLNGLHHLTLQILYVIMCIQFVHNIDCLIYTWNKIYMRVKFLYICVYFSATDHLKWLNHSPVFNWTGLLAFCLNKQRIKVPGIISVNKKVWAQCLFRVIANAISCECGDVIEEMKSINFIAADAVYSSSVIPSVASLQQQGKKKAAHRFKEQPRYLCVNNVGVLWLRKLSILLITLYLCWWSVSKQTGVGSVFTVSTTEQLIHTVF